jgi:hypothetical protein
MKLKFLSFFSTGLAIVVLAACGTSQPISVDNSAGGNTLPDNTATPAALDPGEVTQPEEPVDVQPVELPTATPGEAISQNGAEVNEADPGCLEEIDNAVARAIAEEYSQAASYEQVMVWFCSGAEFEDIITALQTKELVAPSEEVTVEDMLKMLVDGFTWDEIWQSIGVTE